jgi:CheY-like chemotaxis protein
MTILDLSHVAGIGLAGLGGHSAPGALPHATAEPDRVRAVLAPQAPVPIPAPTQASAPPPTVAAIASPPPPSPAAPGALPSPAPVPPAAGGSDPGTALPDLTDARPRATRPGPAADAAASSRPQPPAVLIVDDNVRLARTIAAYMEMQGFRAHPAHSAEEALLAAQQVRFDLVLLDINMPGMDGLEVCRRLIATAPGMRVLMVTGRDSPEDPLRAAAVGARALLTKPISLSSLREQMLRALAT